LRFAAHGDRLVLGARGADRLAEITAECVALGASVYAEPMDVTRPATVQALAAAAVRRYGRIDAWVNTAAVMAYGRLEDVPPEVFDRVVVTNLLGAATVARVALARFRRQRGGTLVLTSSVLGQITAPYVGSYVASKWGQRGLARVLRQENRAIPGIQVCLVSPGSVRTPIYTSAANYVGRIGRPPPPVDPPEKVAAAIVGCVDKPKRDRSVGLANRVVRLGFVVLPPVYDALVGPLMRLGAMSREETGPHEGNVFAPRPPVRPLTRRRHGWLRPAGGVALLGVAAAAAAVRRR
jgi:NAD(P)-dependent dehydrogenase (short-subunit alcohol dehydrogenase family)